MADDRPDVQLARRILSDGWKLGSQPIVPLSAPLDWQCCDGHRSWAFHLHSLDPLGPVLAAYDDTGDGALLAGALSVALDWAEQHPAIEDDTFAWYDMAVGLRAYRLGFLLDVAARDEAQPNDAVVTLLKSLELHLERLADDREFRAHNNHGLFQAAGQLALGTRFAERESFAKAEVQGAQRLVDVVQRQFSDEGVHLEHSPAYHNAVLTTLERISATGLAWAGIDELRERAEDALAWMVQPDGTLPTIGDTDPPFRPPAPLSTLASEHLRHVVSAGSEGRLPLERVKAFPQSGYVMFRDRDSYLMQTCAFHSRTHKHADDLSFVWFDRGVDLLVDAGRYGYLGKTAPGSALFEQGYWYDDPKRMYVESTAAHNAVEIDGQPHPRKGVKPYGSALRRWGEQDGVLFSEAEVRYQASLRHTRVLLARPGAWLVVFDALTDTSHAEHRFVQRFQFGPQLDAVELPGATALWVADQAQPLYAVPFFECQHEGPTRGQGDPMLGWISRKYATLQAVWTDAFIGTGSRHVFATLFAFGDAKPLVDPGSRTNVTGRRARLAWTIDGQRTQLDMNREDDDVEILCQMKDVS